MLDILPENKKEQEPNQPGYQVIFSHCSLELRMDFLEIQLYNFHGCINFGVNI